MTKVATKAPMDGPAAPAVITRMHVQDRLLHDEKTGKPLLGKAGYRHETQFQRACRLGQLVDKAMCSDPKGQNVEIERALDRLADGQRPLQPLLLSMRNLVDADGRIDPQEFAFVGEIEDRLRSAQRL